MQGSRLQVDVADTGRGMTPEEARRIFNAFTRLGKIDGMSKAELKELLGKGNVTVTLSARK